MLKIKEYSIKSNIELKVLLLSDIHYSLKYNHKVLDNIIDKIASIKPNYVCITGDILDESKYADDYYLDFFKSLGSITKTIVIKGNHDVVNKGKFKKSLLILNNEWFIKLKMIKNVFLLENNSIEFNDVIFSGYEEIFNDKDINAVRYSITKFNKNFNISNYIINSNKLNVLLCHSPECFVNKNGFNTNEDLNNFDLILSGHMHNGLIFPFLDKLIKHNGLVSPRKKLFPKNVKGIYKYNNINLIISSGITKLCNKDQKFYKAINKLYNNDMELINFIK